MVEALAWVAIGGAAAYIILGKVDEPEQAIRIRPPPKYMYQSPRTNFAKLSAGMEFYDVKETGTDQYGIPMEWWSTSPSGTSVRVYGNNNAPLFQRFPAQVSALNNKGKKMNKPCSGPGCVRKREENELPERVTNLNEPNITRAPFHEK